MGYIYCRVYDIWNTPYGTLRVVYDLMTFQVMNILVLCGISGIGRYRYGQVYSVNLYHVALKGGIGGPLQYPNRGNMVSIGKIDTVWVCRSIMGYPWYGYVYTV